MNKYKSMVLTSAFLILLLSTSNSFAIVIDGKVEGFGEGYSTGYNVTFDIENGPTGVTGGKLFIEETASFIYVGLITPLTINDNTYGGNKASDWGIKDHFLIGGGGGKSLEGSDKWELQKDKIVDGGGDLEIKLDYIKKFDASDTDFDTKIEKFKQGSDLDQNKLIFQSSLSYNNNILGLTQFFGSKSDDEDGTPINSPLSGGPGDYDFTGVAVDWIPEIMYEFSLDKSALLSGTFDTQGFLDNLGTLHMSPNKLGGHKVFAMIGTQISVPEPATMSLLGIGLLGLVGASARRKFKNVRK